MGGCNEADGRSLKTCSRVGKVDQSSQAALVQVIIASYQLSIKHVDNTSISNTSPN